MPMPHLPATTAAALALALWAGMATAQQIGPGPNAAPPADAAQIFASVCAASLPDFRTAAGAIATLPLRQNPETGTFYHRDLDLSVKLHTLNGESICSVVFTSAETNDQVGQAFAGALGPALGGTAVQSGPDGLIASAELPNGVYYELAANSVQGVTMFRGLMAVAP